MHYPRDYHSLLMNSAIVKVKLDPKLVCKQRLLSLVAMVFVKDEKPDIIMEIAWQH